MQRMRNTLPFLMLFALQYASSHAVQIAFFVAYTLLLHKLNQELKTQIALKQDSDARVLTSIILSSLAAVYAAVLLDAQGARMQQPLFFSFASLDDWSATLATAGIDGSTSSSGSSMTAASVDGAALGMTASTTMDGSDTDGLGVNGIGDLDATVVSGVGSIGNLVWLVLAADVCVRLFFTAAKAVVALTPWPLPLPHWRPSLPYFAISPALLRLPIFRKASHGKKTYTHHHHHHHAPSAAGRLSEGRTLAADVETLLAEMDTSFTTTNGSTTHAASRSLGGSSSSTSSSSSVGRRPMVVERSDHRDSERSSVYTRKRRLYCLLEELSLLVRSTLPVPAWLAYYAADRFYGDVFIWLYLTFKCTVLCRHAKSVLIALRLACRASQLEYGRRATREEEAQEASSDCSICFESLGAVGRTVVLPCDERHAFFHEECIATWLDRERSCPVCRAAVSHNYEQGRPRTGSTSALPCIL